jgi:hypothetical protein
MGNVRASVILLILFLSAIGCTIPSVESNAIWWRTFGGTEADYGNDIVECRSGGYAIIGGSISFGNSSTAVWLLRINANGELIWNQTFGGVNGDSGTALQECSDGGFIITGYSRTYTHGRQDIWLIRTDAAGNLVWHQYFGGFDTDHGMDVIEVSDGGFALIGNTRSFGSVDPATQIRTYDIWLIRTTDNGLPLWNRTYGFENDDIARALVELEGGGFLILGDLNSNYEFVGTDPGWDFTSDGWLIRTDATGQVVWNRTYAGEGHDFVRSIIPLSEGGFAIAGFSQSYGTGSYDGWFIQTDALGNDLSNLTYGGSSEDLLQTILRCDDGGFALVGYTFSTGMGAGDVWMVRTDTMGNELWTQTFGGSRDETGRSCVQNQDGTFTITGYTFSFGAGDRDVLLVTLLDAPPASDFPMWILGIVLLSSTVAVVFFGLMRWRKKRIRP